MKIRYCIFDGKNQFLATIKATISGKNGGRIMMTFTERISDLRSPPLIYQKVIEAQTILALVQTHLSPEATEGFEVMEITFNPKDESIIAKSLSSGLTVAETGTLT